MTTPLNPRAALARAPACLALTMSMFAAGAAVAEARQPDVALELGVRSQQVGKGLGQSEGDPSVFGAATLARGPLYATASGNTIKLGAGGDFEAIAAIGVRQTLGGFDLDVSLRSGHRFETADGFDRHFVEYQADIGRTIGRASARLRINYSPNADGPAREAWWNEAMAGWAVTDAASLTAAVAKRDAEGGADYTAWNVGLTHRLPHGFAGDLRFYDTNRHRFGPEFGDRVVASLAKTF